MYYKIYVSLKFTTISMLSILNSLLFPNFAQISWGCSSLSGNIRRWIWSKSKWKSQNKKAKHCRFIQAKKVEVPDVVMAIHPHLEGEFWGPTVDLLLDENVVTGVKHSHLPAL